MIIVTTTTISIVITVTMSPYHYKYIPEIALVTAMRGECSAGDTPYTAYTVYHVYMCVVLVVKVIGSDNFTDGRKAVFHASCIYLP